MLHKSSIWSPTNTSVQPTLHLARLLAKEFWARGTICNTILSSSIKALISYMKWRHLHEPTLSPLPQLITVLESLSTMQYRIRSFLSIHSSQANQWALRWLYQPSDAEVPKRRLGFSQVWGPINSQQHFLKVGYHREQILENSSSNSEITKLPLDVRQKFLGFGRMILGPKVYFCPKSQ